MTAVEMTGRPDPAEVIAILLALRARPGVTPEPPAVVRRRVRPPVAESLHGPRSWRFTPARAR
ncbi:hypothetical protein GCM10010172_19360 [Paractinoplanes ferrugineus]|uniref:Acyl-CoA carboxylase epsilon subunit-like protein n=1 Tax=Paractinoplanes ferrugineus TaxID=113564 RepID=A0A919MHV8_9ACTN|nr:hypothetical protein [Actinoplanes ferrugineus]GIE16233.1 hypothetical protein Afe05nite_80730 [Actinoplanes ferrugineus]